MAASKCGNCGADIPENATFCPGCGASKGAAPQAAQPMRMGPSSMGNSSPLESLFNMVFSKTAIILGAAIGVLLAWIGGLILIFAPLSGNIAFLLSSMGFAAIGLLLVGGGIWNKKIDKFARLGMIIIGAYSIVQTVSVTGLITNIANALG